MLASPVSAANTRRLLVRELADAVVRVRVPEGSSGAAPSPSAAANAAAELA